MSQDQPYLTKKKRFIPPFIKSLIIISLIIFAMFVFFKSILTFMIGDLGDFTSPIERFSVENKKNEAQLEEIRLIAESHDDPFLGNKDAKLVIVKFMDFGCPFCKKEVEVIERLVGKYPQDIKFIFRDFPIESLHPGAMDAAKAANCAHQQGQYWNMSKLIYEEQDLLFKELFLSYARDLQLDEEKYQACVNSPLTEKEIQADQMDGISIGVGQTPVFFINGQRIAGAIPYETFERIIQITLGK